MEESLEIGLRAMRSNQKMSDMNTFEIKNIYIYIYIYIIMVRRENGFKKAQA